MISKHSTERVLDGNTWLTSGWTGALPGTQHSAPAVGRYSQQTCAVSMRGATRHAAAAASAERGTSPRRRGRPPRLRKAARPPSRSTFEHICHVLHYGLYAVLNKIKCSWFPSTRCHTTNIKSERVNALADAGRLSLCVRHSIVWYVSRLPTNYSHALDIFWVVDNFYYRTRCLPPIVRTLTTIILDFNCDLKIKITEVRTNFIVVAGKRCE